MKKISYFSLVLIISLFFSQNSFSQVSIKSGTSISATIPTSSTDRLRVEKGNISQRVNGTIGRFEATDQWIRLGMPSSTLYGMRVQWNQQGFNYYLNQRSNSTIKDAIIGWGNQGGELQFRYLNDAQSFTKILALTPQGNAYMGGQNSGVFTNPKLEIYTRNQLAFAIKDSNSIAASIINIPNNPDVYSIVPSLEVKSVSTSNTGRTDGIFGSAEGANVNLGVWGNADYGSNFNAGVQGSAHNAGVTGVGVQGIATGSPRNIGVYGTAYDGDVNFAGYFAGNVFTEGTYSASDKKLKKDIAPEDLIMDKIKSLKPVHYNFKSEEFKTLHLSKVPQHGFLAQDVKEIFPEMVTTVVDPALVKGESVHNEFLAINYTMFIPVLTKGLQEQQEYIEKLERRITDLENAFQKNGDVKVTEDYENIKNVTIDQNVPNPFNQKTTISYNIPSQLSNASVAIFDLTGKLLLQYDDLKGKSQIAVEGNKLSAGMYIYSLLVNGKEVTSKKMILTK